MPAIRMKINPTVLRWAMDQAGVDELELADDISIDPVEVHAWLNHLSQPNTGELKKLAKALRRPTSIFFMAHPPRGAVAAAAFRAPRGLGGERDISRLELDEIRAAGRKQKIVGWVRQHLDEGEPVTLPEFGKDADAVAEAARRWLGWNIQLQVKATSKSAVTKELRKAIEGRGLLVLQLSMTSDACRGFSIAGRTAPVIAYNIFEQVAAARTFTILHELGHLIRDEQAVCEQPTDAAERWCDEFAASFLLPEQHLVQYLQKQLHRSFIEDEDEESIRLISQRFKASYQCVALRLIKLKRANWRLYDLVRRPGAEVDKGFPSPVPQTTPRIRLREFGRTYVGAIVGAKNDGLLSEIDARKYLNVNGQQLVTLERQLVSGE